MHPKCSKIYLLICTFYSIVAGKINGIYVCGAAVILKICEGPQKIKLFLKFHRGITSEFSHSKSAEWK